MVEAMIAMVTCGSREEARTIAEALVENHLAACVNVIPSIESCYRWEGRLNWDTEYLLLVKTTEDAIDRVHERVIEAHSYDLPEFIALKIHEGSAPYLKWIEDSVEV